MNKLSKILLIIVVSFCLLSNVNAIYSDSNANLGTYEEELKKFPYEYQQKIEELHKIYPNALFVVQDEFFDWKKYKEIPVSWNSMFNSQKGERSLIQSSVQDSYKTDKCGQTSNGRCVWSYASDEAISYYLNPYNFLNEKNIFMFESLYSKSYHTKEGVEKILAGSFMANKNCPGSDKTYAEVILEAGEKNNVSPYMLASRLIQEQGRNGSSSLISGTYEGANGELKGYYNYFNIQASGNTDQAVIENGLKCAKGTLNYCSGNNWDSPYASIVGGSKFVYKKYVGINDTYNVKGQMTLYLQKWDPYGPKLGGHQYMQNIQAPVSESITTFNSYASYPDYKNYSYVFYIPIYEGAPNTKAKVSKIDDILLNNKLKINDNYLSGISINTSQDTFESNLKKENSNISVVFEKNSNNKSNNLASGDKITIKLDGETKEYEVVMYGDVNGDGEINSDDLLLVQSYVFKYMSFDDSQIARADVNNNNKVNEDDLLLFQSYVLGYIKSF